MNDTETVVYCFKGSVYAYSPIDGTTQTVGQDETLVLTSVGAGMVEATDPAAGQQFIKDTEVLAPDEEEDADEEAGMIEPKDLPTAQQFVKDIEEQTTAEEEGAEEGEGAVEPADPATSQQFMKDTGTPASDEEKDSDVGAGEVKPTDPAAARQFIKDTELPAPDEEKDSDEEKAAAEEKDFDTPTTTDTGEATTSTIFFDTGNTDVTQDQTAISVEDNVPAAPAPQGPQGP